MARRKPKLFEKVEVVDLDVKGRGVIKSEADVAFVPETAPGDTIDARAFKKKKGVYEAHLLQIHDYSPKRSEPFCAHFDDCGGCKLQHISYEAQLEFKEKLVKDAFMRIAAAAPIG